MSFSLPELTSIGAACVAILMAGSRHLRLNLWLYSLQAFLIASASALIGWQTHETHLFVVAFVIAVVKAGIVPLFLNWIVDRIKVRSDAGTMLPAPLTMHLSVLLLGLGYIIASQLNLGSGIAGAGAIAALSLLFTGLLFMLTRRVALSQIVGFLTLENGIFLFAVSQTQGMPLMIEMGILLDVLVGVMIAGLLLFRIQKSFEHIDVTQLTELKE